MSTKIFINLAVRDLNRAIAFYTALGYSFNPQFTDETATCMIISETIYAMLLTEEKFKSFTSKELVDARRSIEVMLALSAESREEVDNMIAKVIKAGGKEHGEVQDYGFMYYRSYEDLDGHVWELTYMPEENAA